MPRLLSVTLGAAVAAALVLSAREAATPEKPVPAPVMTGARSLFVSGHSLTAPLSPFLSAIAEGAGRPLRIGTHSVDGSSIRGRLAAGAAAIPPAGTDVLLVTERHGVLDAMSLEGTVDELRRLDVAFRQTDPAGETFFYLPWADVSDFAAPADWIRYERMAAPIWACAAREAGDASMLPGARRIHLVPASLALASLVETLDRDPAAVGGFAGSDKRDVGAALFSDNVHVTPLGGFFLANLTDATIFGEGAAQVPLPADLDPARAAGLRDFALRFAANWRESGGGPLACGGRVSISDILAYSGYMARTYGDPGAGFLRQQASRLRHVARLIRDLTL
jgi:hypothetical protein